MTTPWNSRSFNTNRDNVSRPIFQMKTILRKKFLGSIPKFITRRETSLSVYHLHKSSRLSCAKDAKNGPIRVRDMQRCYIIWTKEQRRF